MDAPFHLILVILAILLFGIAAFVGSYPEPSPWHRRFIAAGLFCWALSTIIRS
jgi:hypothetical protein